MKKFKEFNEAVKKTKGAKLSFEDLDAGDQFFGTSFHSIAGSAVMIKTSSELKVKGSPVNSIMLDTGEPVFFKDNEMVIFHKKGK